MGDVCGPHYGHHMAARIDLTLDCSDARLLAEFWKTALGYIDEPPPAPFTTREEWFSQFDLPADDSVDDAAWLCDPDGVGPRLSILKSRSRRRRRTGSTSTSGYRCEVDPTGAGRSSRRRPSASCGPARASSRSMTSTT